jgi:hypothetical protein
MGQRVLAIVAVVVGLLLLVYIGVTLRNRSMPPQIAVAAPSPVVTWSPLQITVEPLQMTVEPLQMTVVAAPSPVAAPSSTSVPSPVPPTVVQVPTNANAGNVPTHSFATPVKVTPEILPRSFLQTNGLENQATAATNLLLSKPSNFKDAFTSCYYDKAQFIDGLSTISLNVRASIFVIDDRATEGFLTQNGMPLFSGDGLLQEYGIKFGAMGWLGAYTENWPVSPGEYELRFAKLREGDFEIKDGMRILNAPPTVINDTLVIMLCEAK